MTMFNGYIMVDWSAANRPTTGANSIWVAELIGGKKNIENFSTREETYDYLIDIISKTKEKQRLLIGLDFAFGYPADAYDKFNCENKNVKNKNWKYLWTLISAQITDNHRNKNNRFEVAGKLNTHFKGGNPFWGHNVAHNFNNLVNNPPPENYGIVLPREKRCIDTLTNGKSVWNIYNPGSVGSQTLMGIPTLQKLKERGDCCVWPFQDLDETKHVIAEIYPSIWDIQGDHDINDANQAYTVAKNIAYLDKNELLQNFLNAPFDYERDNKINEGDITKKEGWMLGIDENGRPAKCP